MTTITKTEVEPNEIEALRELASANLSIPTLLEVNDDEITLKYVPGKELYELIENEYPFKFEEKLFITDQLLEIVRGIHNHGWIHGDIHSSNIIIDDELNVTLIDFGNAVRDEEVSTFGSLFIPPEAISIDGNKVEVDETYSPNRGYDYWALGVTLFSLFIDEPSPSASSFMIGQMSPNQIDEVYVPYQPRLHLSGEINRLLSHLLNHDPHQRGF